MKRGLSGIVTSLIVIGVGLLAVGIVWVVISNVISESSAEVENESSGLFEKIKVTGSVPFTSCRDLFEQGYDFGDGIYTIDPDGKGGEPPFEVYCDMTTDGGGWTKVLNAVRVVDWGNLRVNESVVLNGSGEYGVNNNVNGWVGVKYWNGLGDEMIEFCEGATAGFQEKTGNFSLNESNNYSITWKIGGNFQSWHNGRQLSTKDYNDRCLDPHKGRCVDMTGHESSGWGWHRSYHIGSAWFGSNGMPICHVVPGAHYSGNVSESEHVQWFIR